MQRKRFLHQCLKLSSRTRTGGIGPGALYNGLANLAALEEKGQGGIKNGRLYPVYTRTLHHTSGVPISIASAVESTSSSASFIDITSGCLAGIQASTGLPWWATISMATIGVRMALLPFVVQQSKASMALGPLLRKLSNSNEKSGEETSESPKTMEDYRDHFRIWNDSRIKKGEASPIWLLTPLFVQLPTFVTMMLTVRHMSFSSQYGFESGGMLWFKDLSLQAFDMTALTAPMGPMGIILPGSLCMLYMFNLQQSFGMPTSGFFSMYKIVLELFSIPMLLIGIQLPQGVFCYWLTSTTFNTMQTQLLKFPQVRQAFDLNQTSLQDATLPNPEKGESSSSRKQEEAVLGSKASIHDRASELVNTGKGHETIVIDSSNLSSLNYKSAMTLAHNSAKKDNWKDAYQLFTIAASKTDNSSSPDCIKAMFFVAVSLFKLNKKQKALKMFEKVVEKDPQNAHALLSIASIYKQLGRLDDAIVWTKKASKIDKKVENTYLKELLDAKQQEKS